MSQKLKFLKAGDHLKRFVISFFILFSFTQIEAAQFCVWVRCLSFTGNSVDPTSCNIEESDEVDGYFFADNIFMFPGVVGYECGPKDRKEAIRKSKKMRDLILLLRSYP